MDKKLSAELSEKYTRFRTHLRRSWINVQLHSEIKKLLQEKCEEPNFSESVVVDCVSPVGSEKQANIRLRGKSLLGFVESGKGAGTEWALKRTLASSIALFEAFISDISQLVYLNDPERFLLGGSNQVPSEKENYKVIEILVKSDSKEEALEKLVEERLRGIFYGNPIDAFIKYPKNGTQPKDGKLKLGLNQCLHEHCSYEIKQYAEMVGRRNAIVHNAGIIDSKYVREVEHIQEKLGINSKVKIDEDYLFTSLKALDKIATYFVNQVSSTCQLVRKPKNAKV